MDSTQSEDYMKFSKYLIKLRYIFIVIIFICIYMLLRIQRCYINGDSTNFFTVPQLKELDKIDSILALAIVNVMNRKSNEIAFFVFSPNDFNTLQINSISVIYDGRKKTFDYNIVYNMDFDNPNFEQIVSYNIDNTIIQGYKKRVVPGFMNFEPCWINFYDLFKWKHHRIGDKFEVKLIVNYGLDNRQYNQELNYRVRCEKSYPDNLLKSIF